MISCYIIYTYYTNGGIITMIKLDVLSMLDQQGKTKYWLWKQLGMSYQNFNKMVNNETKSIRYETIDTLCVIFSCTPNDLFIYEPEKEQN